MIDRPSPAEKKNQHYVPKFYLRKFSYKSNKKQIGVFNIDNKFYYPTASLKSLACKPFFYGSDGTIEDALSVIENVSAILIDNICNYSYLPKPKTKDHWDLLFFVLLLEYRNPIMSQNLNNGINALYNETYGNENFHQASFKKNNFGLPNAVLDALAGMDIIMEYCDDLSYRILKNKTSIPFITSDNPVIKYNQFLESRKWPGNGSAITSIGIEIFLAINSTTMIIFFDSWAYKFGNRKQQIIDITSGDEIDQINLLHFLNCEKTVFFNEKISEYYIKSLFEKSKKFERANITKTLRVPESDKMGNRIPNSTLIFSTFTDCKTKLNLSFIKQKDQAKAHKLDNRIVQPRPNYWKKKNTNIAKNKIR